MSQPNFNDPLDDLLGTSIANLDIPEAVYLRVLSRYDDAAGWLEDYWATSPTGGLLYPQGSMRLGTVVQPVNPDDEYDLDFVCRRDLAKTSTTQTGLKLDVGRGLSGFVRARPEGAPTLGEGKRCWTLDYPGEPFHMDVLPSVPDPDGPANGILLTDKSLLEWQHSNPIDFADWFHWRMRSEFIEQRSVLAKQMQVEDVPDWRVKTTLQKATQALKRHRDIYFVDRPDDRPASIIITTLAALAYVDGGSMFEVLVDVTARMPTFIENRNGVLWVPNPVCEKENFADRWRSHPGRAHAFFEWIERAQADFSSYGQQRGLDRVIAKLGSTLGAGPASRAAELFGTRARRQSALGAVGMEASGLLLPVATRSEAIPHHTNHGGAFPVR